jgi:hypothetical protein
MTLQIVKTTDTRVRVITITAPTAAVFATARGRPIVGNLRDIPNGGPINPYMAIDITILDVSVNMPKIGGDGTIIQGDRRLEVARGRK